MGTLRFDSAEEYGKRAEPSARRRSARAEAGKDRPVGLPAAWWRAILIAAIALGALGAAGWGVRWFLRNDPRFYFASVELHGRRFAAASQIEDQFVLDRGRSIFRLPLEERRRAIEQIPWVRSATVTRVFPNKIAVAIQERVPVAFLDSAEGIDLIDEEGVILEMPPQAVLSQGAGGQASFTFPVVRGITAEEPAAARREKMQLFLALMADLDRGDPRLREEISEVDLGDLQDVRVILADSSGAVVLHLGRQDFLSRYLLYASRVAEWKQKFANLESVDLRFEGQVVLNGGPQRAPAAPSTERPAPAQVRPPTTENLSTGAAGRPTATESRPARTIASTADSPATPEPAANPNPPPATP